MQSKQNFCNLQSFSMKDLDNQKIAIFGGSFNPPHKGHLLLSKKALELGMDKILWLPAKQNPLKDKYIYSSEERIDLCCTLTKDDPDIWVSDLEIEINSQNSYETLEYLTSHFKNTHFIWIMGIDCLKQFHLWENYDKFPEIVDMVIFNRKDAEDLFETSKAGKILKGKVRFIPEILSELSSTKIRQKL